VRELNLEIAALIGGQGAMWMSPTTNTAQMRIQAQSHHLHIQPDSANTVVQIGAELWSGIVLYDQG
jgi:hypothetical protein